MNAWSRQFSGSLTLKIGAIIVLAEIVVLAITGVAYVTRFRAEIDRRLEDQVQLPGELMTSGLLSYQSVGDKTVMEDLVGENLLDGLVVGLNREVFYSLDSAQVGQTVDDQSALEFRDRLDPTLTESLILRSEDNQRLINITPLRREDGVLIGHLYIRIGTV